MIKIWKSLGAILVAVMIVAGIVAATPLLKTGATGVYNGVYNGCYTSGPDLTITSGSPTITPSQDDVGWVILSAWTVKNQGNTHSGVFANGFYFSTDSIITADDTYLGGNANSLAPGEEYNWGGPSVPIPDTPPGVYYIGILVDSLDWVSELNESNNYVSSPITLPLE